MQKSSVLSKLEATFTISSAGGIFIQHMLFIERQCVVLPRYIDFDFNVRRVILSVCDFNISDYICL
jgi:hypothetical protein